MAIWRGEWQKAEGRQRVLSVLAVEDQQTLYEIAFGEDDELLQTVALYKLNQMSEFEEIGIYHKTGAYFGSGTEPEHDEWVSGDYYEDNPVARERAVRYIVSQKLLFLIAARDPNNSVAYRAIMMLDTNTLESVFEFSFRKSAANMAGDFIEKRNQGLPKCSPLPLAMPDWIEKIIQTKNLVKADETN